MTEMARSLKLKPLMVIRLIKSYRNDPKMLERLREKERKRNHIHSTIVNTIQTMFDKKVDIWTV